MTSIARPPHYALYSGLCGENNRDVGAELRGPRHQLCDLLQRLHPAAAAGALLGGAEVLHHTNISEVTNITNSNHAGPVKNKDM